MLQHTPEWYAHRARHFNASEAGAVMGVNPWAPRNPAELFDLKTGALTIPETPAMRRGTELEQHARALAEQLLDESFTPCVRTRDRYSASLDGLCLDGMLCLEVKCPGEKSELWNLKTADDLKAVAPYYWWQLVHQHYVVGFSSVLFLVYDPERHNAIQIHSDLLAADRDALLAAWERFAESMDSNTRPDDGERTDTEWVAAAEDYRAAKAAEAEAISRVDDAKKRLIALAGDMPAKGAGVSIIKATRTGSIDTKAAQEAGIDLSPFRKPDTSYLMVK